MLTLDRADQAFSLHAIAVNASRFASRPWDLLGRDQCFPIARPHTLGEHVLGEGLLGALPWALTRDPILTFNAVAFLTIVLPAIAVFALAFYFTGNAPAAWVAGLLFAFHPARLAAISKPFLIASQWTPLVLLFEHRLFGTRRWRDAAALAAVVGLQLLTSFYQVLGALLLCGAYGLALAVVHRRALGELAPKLLAVAVFGLAIAAPIYLPYLHTREVFGVLHGRPQVFFYWRHFFLPRGPAFPGAVALALAAIGFLDRLRGARPRDGCDPRVPLLLAGLWVVWCLSTGIELPLGLRLPSPIGLAAGVVPGLDAVRVLPLARFAYGLVVAALAAYGVVALVERLSPRARALAISALALAALAEIDWPPLSRRTYLEQAGVGAYPARPLAQEIDLYRAVPPGAVLDLPFRRDDPRGALAVAPYLRAAAWHRQPLAACYNSFSTPVLDEVEALAERLPDPSVLDELGALGFRRVIVHENLLSTAERERLAAWLEASDSAASPGGGETPASGASPPIARAPGLSLRRLAPPARIADLSALVPAEQAPLSLTGARAPVELAFQNAGDATYRHPDPIEPTRLRVVWRAPSGDVARESAARLLLPIALPPGGVATRSVELDLPQADGDYQLEVSAESAPQHVLARRAVRRTSDRGRSDAAPGG